MKKYIQEHAVIFYFIAAYAIAWGGVLFVFRNEGLEPYQGESVLSGKINPNYLYVWIAMLVAPAIAGILFTLITGGREGIRKLFASLIKWKVSLKWYSLAIFIFPVVLLLLFLFFSVFSPRFYPSHMIVIGLSAGVIGGFFEEIGWTGFALPKLQQFYSPFKAAIILGIIHTFWHLLADWWGGVNFYKELYVIHFVLWVLCLTALRIIITWIYNNTSSLLLAQLTHATFTASQLMFTPPALNATESVVWYMGFVLVVWGIVAAILIVEKTKKNTQAEIRIESLRHAS